MTTMESVQETPPKKKITFNDKLVIMMLAWADFLNFCCMSIMAPFYPKEASEKGMSETVSGLVFGFYGIMVIVASPIAGLILPRIGMKVVFTSGLIIMGATNILFGLLDFVDDYTTFTILSFLIRGCLGIGTALYTTGSFVIITKIFPDHGGLVRGILEVFVGLGLSVGPAIGGFLFNLGGFQLPFYTVGGIFLIITPLNKCFLPDIKEEQNGQSEKCNGSFKKLIRIPFVIVGSVNLVIFTATWSCLNPTLEPYLRKYELSVTTVSFVFLLLSIMYLLSSPVSGWLSDRISNFWILMIAGLILTGICMVLMGLSEYLFDSGSFWWDATYVGLLGVFIGLGIIPTYQAVLDGAIYHGKFDDNISTQGLVAGLWSSLYSAGEAIGPVAGGAIFSNLGFPLMVGLIGLINILVGVVGFIYYYRNRENHNILRKEYINRNCQMSIPSITESLENKV